MEKAFKNSPEFSKKVLLKKLLLICGIFSSLLYITSIIIGAILWDDYSSFSQTVSELIAINAPSASLVIPLFIVYSILIYAFGIGVWMSAGNKRALRIAAVLIIGKEVFGLLATLFAPMHLRGTEITLTDTMHIVFTMVGTLLCMFPAMGFSASAFGKGFRLYTIVTMLIFIVFGALSGIDGPRIAANLPTPWLGIWERINIFGYLIWIIVLAVILLQQERKLSLINAPIIDQQQ